jgi:hypothetical protein
MEQKPRFIAWLYTRQGENIMSTDWMPGRRADIITMAKVWNTVIYRNAKKWNIPDEVLTELERLTEEAQDALGDAMSANRNAVITAKCTMAFDALTAKMRFIKDRYFKEPPLRESDFIELLLKPKDKTPTPVPVPTAQAEADVTYQGPTMLMLHMRPLAGTSLDSRADYGYRVYYGVLPPGGATVEEATGPHRYLMKAAVHGNELPHSRFVRRRKELFIFPPEDSVKTAFFCIRYENSKGQAGPWGPVFSAVIP